MPAGHVSSAWIKELKKREKNTKMKNIFLDFIVLIYIDIFCLIY